jgi:hypothetical protein
MVILLILNIFLAIFFSVSGGIIYFGARMVQSEERFINSTKMVRSLSKERG